MNKYGKGWVVVQVNNEVDYKKHDQWMNMPP